MSRAKEKILEGIFAEDSASTQELPSYLNELSRINSNLHIEIQRDVGGRFDKPIIALDSKVFTNGQHIFGVDAAHMKYRNYNGVQLILVARDGNMKKKTALVALIPVENAENYKWFFGILLSRGYPLSTIPVFSDRHTGILAAAETLTIRVFFCTRRIIGTADPLAFSGIAWILTLCSMKPGKMRADKAIRLQVSQEALMWGAQASETKARYDMLKGVDINASRYMKALNPVQWALHPHHCTAEEQQTSSRANRLDRCGSSRGKFSLTSTFEPTAKS